MSMMPTWRLLGCVFALAIALAVVAGVLFVTRDVGRAATVTTTTTSEQQHTTSASNSSGAGLLGHPSSRRTGLIAVLGALGIALVGASIFVGPRAPAPAPHQR